MHFNSLNLISFNLSSYIFSSIIGLYFILFDIICHYLLQLSGGHVVMRGGQVAGSPSELSLAERLEHFRARAPKNVVDKVG